MFLLDDGWFANSTHARNDDRAGLGDWDENHDKLPGGLPALTKAAKEAGVKFGLWTEPEMVNPNSELYEKQKAVLFAYNIHPRYNEKILPVKLQGLDPNRRYKVEETNLLPGQTSGMRGHGKTFTGDYLMKVGLDAFYTGEMTSRVIEITAEHN